MAAAAAASWLGGAGVRSKRAGGGSAPNAGGTLNSSAELRSARVSATSASAAGSLGVELGDDEAAAAVEDTSPASDGSVVVSVVVAAGVDGGELAATSSCVVPGEPAEGGRTDRSCSSSMATAASIESAMVRRCGSVGTSAASRSPPSHCS